MSALEQIRKRPGLIVSILGLALLLFIFTAISNPEKLFVDPTTVVKVDGKKIDITTFQSRVEQQRQMMQQQGYSNVDIALIQERTLQQLVAEAVMESELDKLGITVTSNELSAAMLGETAIPYVQQSISQMGIPSADMLYDYAFNPTQNGLSPEQAQQLKEMWYQLENQTKEMLRQQKFGNLIMGSLVANKLDAQSMYEDNASTDSIRYAKIDVMSLPDNDFPVTDAEIASRYNKDKNQFRIANDQYMINYILVDVTPSSDDQLAATQAVENAIMGLKQLPGTEAVSGDLNFIVNRINTSAAKLPASISKVLDTLKSDSVMQVSFFDNKYTIAKLIGESTAVDSMNVDFVILNEGVNVDSVLVELNAGTSVEALGDKVAQSQLDQKISLLDPAYTQFVNVLGEAETGKYFAPGEAAGFNNQVIFHVNSKSAPVNTYDIAEITYHLEPSNATINDTNEKLRGFVAENNTAAKFIEAAAAAGYTAIPATVTEASLSVNGVSDTQSLAKWATKADKGAVSPIYGNDDNSHFVVAALRDIYSTGYVPVSDNQVRDVLTSRIRNEKKAEKLLADYQGKASSIEEYAALMNAKVDTTAVTFGQNYVRNFTPGDTKLIAAVAKANQGELTGPTATNYSVVVFEIFDTEKQGREFDLENDTRYFEQAQGANALMRNFTEILLGNKKIDYKIQKFYGNN